MTPYGQAKLDSLTKIFPPDIIARKRIIMTMAVTPGMLGNYAAGLIRFTKFCDDFHIPEEARMPASEDLLCMFVTTRGAGAVAANAMKNWLLGLELWHIINCAPWHGGKALKRAVEGSSRLAPTTSHQGKRGPIIIEHIHTLARNLNFHDPFDCAFFAVACIAFWCCCR
jgi:hypothetical protein